MLGPNYGGLKKKKKKEKSAFMCNRSQSSPVWNASPEFLFFAFDRDANQFGAAAMFYRCGVPGGAWEMGTCSSASLFGPPRCCLRNTSASFFFILFLYSSRSLSRRRIDPPRAFWHSKLKPAAFVRRLTFRRCGSAHQVQLWRTCRFFPFHLRF